MNTKFSAVFYLFGLLPLIAGCNMILNYYVKIEGIKAESIVLHGKSYEVDAVRVTGMTNSDTSVITSVTQKYDQDTIVLDIKTEISTKSELSKSGSLNILIVVNKNINKIVLENGSVVWNRNFITDAMRNKETPAIDDPTVKRVGVNDLQ